jgi:hypothetical protein
LCAGVTAVAGIERRRLLHRHHACLTPACESGSACVRACLRAWAQLRHGRRGPRQHGERLVSPPYRGDAGRLSFCTGVNFVAGTDVLHEPLSVGRSHAVATTRVLTWAGFCVCRCAYMPACVGAVTPRSAGATRTRRAPSASPYITAKRVDVCFALG